MCVVLCRAVPVDVNHADDLGYTALHHAAGNGFLNIVRVLLNHPRLVSTAVNAYGVTAEAAARQHRHFLVADAIAVWVRRATVDRRLSDVVMRWQQVVCSSRVWSYCRGGSG